MLVLSNHVESNQNGRDNTANNIPRPIETMIKSITQAINLSIQRASTIVSVSVGVDDDEDKVVVLLA